MNIRYILIILCSCVTLSIPAQEVGWDDVLEDIYNQLSEESETSWSDLQEELMEIAAHPNRS